MIKKAIIPAAGLGTRFRPITKTFPKEMLPIIDKPCLEYIIEEAAASGIEEIILIISDKKAMIKEYFGNIFEYQGKMIRIGYAYQEEQKGLGHAVLMTKDLIGNNAFACLLGDDMFVSKTPALKQLIDVYENNNGTILGTIAIDKSDSNKYGICDPLDGESGKVLRLKGVIEKPDPKDAPSNLAISGRYILIPSIFKYLETQTAGALNEIQLTDAILRQMSEVRAYAYKIDGKRYDIGKKDGFVEATVHFGLSRDIVSKEDVKKMLKK
ncbi:UTP--glucose-1-phosphate uridylyltransferase [Acholeplasma sp. OttesenSCG-928-E16]|nr:UTP--glucose-1-phosphate uridylyltransferase [Acholeplasma sp. OttesenSCG-928-E16]